MQERPHESSPAHEDASRHSRAYWEERERRQEAGKLGKEEETEMLDLLKMTGHDLQAPLKVLKLNVEFLTDERSSPELRAKSKRIIKRIASRLEFLLQDVLEMAEAGEAKFVLHETKFDLAEVVKQSVETYGLLAEELGMAVDVDVSQALPVEGDKMRLAQACMNILTETIWTSPRGSRIQVQAIREGEKARLVISCQPGRQTESLKSLEEPSRDSMSSSQSKSSLALYLTRGILEQHGGSLVVERGPDGRANTFTVRIPLISV